MGSTTGDLPPYRFLYLIERAKAYAASLSGFGAALLATLEKKEGEQLNRLRLTQQMNLLQLTTQIRRQEIDTASEALVAAQSQLDAAQYRSDYFSDLMSGGLSDWEYAEAAGRHVAAGLKAMEGTLGLLAAGFGFLPQVGSPFAMKYGGVELHAGTKSFADASGSVAAVSDSVATSAGLQGNFARRRDGWKNQQTLAGHDVDALGHQVKAASIRLDIANRSLALHEKSIDQLQEQLDLADGRFTNLGLYTWLSAQLQRSYRGAYQNALALAKLAERAYRFERGDDDAPGLTMSYWDPTHGGLLAGEQLLADLQTLERRFIETNYRAIEVDQAFALSQVDPRALVALRQGGECTFSIDEVFFDLCYPGQYKRRIKSVRLTIPCVTGPYVNVSATLNLTRSWLRSTPTGTLIEVPPSRSVSIAATTAQNDAGVFELSFRDERYMPFEGLGAVSEWQLRLPKAFRLFDYDTITDAIISISYTAEYDGALSDRVESTNAAVVGSIVEHFTNNSARRVFSMRQDFSSPFTRALRSAAGTPARFEITQRHLPMFAQPRPLQIVRGVVLLRVAPGGSAGAFQLSVDGTAVTGFATDPTLGNLLAAPLPAAFTGSLVGPHSIVIDNAGNLGPTSPQPGDPSAIDPDKLADVLFYVEYRFA
jgi:hypothetical protein